MTSGRRDDGGKKGGKKGSKGSKPTGTVMVTRTKKHWKQRQGQGQKQGPERNPILLRLRRTRAYRNELSFKWTTSIDEDEDQGSSWESELEGGKAE